MVLMQDVFKTYDNGTKALKGINMEIEEGEFVFLVGPSGSGKSTIIKLINAEIRPTAGKLVVNDFDLTKIKRRRVPRFRRSLGVIFQDFRLIDKKTVYENVAFAMRVIGASNKDIVERVPYVLELVGLQNMTKRFPDELSGGEQQRVAIARALANDPGLIIADEPTGNIDPQLSYEIVELLRKINRQNGTTIIMVTHEHDLVKYFGGRIINIENGSITFDENIGGASDEDE